VERITGKKEKIKELVSALNSYNNLSFFLIDWRPEL